MRLAGLRPARVKELEAGTRLMRALLDGESVDVGAEQPARLPHHRPVPIWIAAGGPRTLRMAGSGRRSVHPRGNAPGEHLDGGGSDPGGGRGGRTRSGAVRLGAVFHTVLVDEPGLALTMAKSMAAGYYEYSPTLFDPPRLEWTGPSPETLKRDRQVFPDFHHAPDLAASGRAVDFLPTSAADAFSLRGGPAEVADQLIDVLRRAPAEFDYVVLHPIPNPPSPDDLEAWLYGAGSARGAAARATRPPAALAVRRDVRPLHANLRLR